MGRVAGAERAWRPRSERRDCGRGPWVRSRAASARAGPARGPAPVGAAGPPRAVSAMQAHGEGPPGLAGLLPQGPGPQAKQSRSRGGRQFPWARGEPRSLPRDRTRYSPRLLVFIFAGDEEVTVSFSQRANPPPGHLAPSTPPGPPQTGPRPSLAAVPAGRRKLWWAYFSTLFHFLLLNELSRRPAPAGARAGRRTEARGRFWPRRRPAAESSSAALCGFCGMGRGLERPGLCLSRCPPCARSCPQAPEHFGRSAGCVDRTRPV